VFEKEDKMRRKDREITDMNRIMEILKNEDVCCVAFQDEPFPYLIPMNYGAQMEDGKLVLYFHGAAAGTKLEMIKKNPNVSFTVFGNNRITVDMEAACKSTTSFDSVCGSGRAVIVPEEEKRKGLAVLMNHMSRTDNKAFDETSFPDGAVSGTAVWKIVVENVVGKHHD